MELVAVSGQTPGSILKHLKKYSKKRVVGLTYAQIEELIGEGLSYGAKAFDHY